MFNIFEQPWTLLGASVLVLFGVLTYRSVWDNKHWWQFLLPVFCASLAFGLDNLVQTDREKIQVVLNTGLQAVVARDIGKIDTLIADDYSDSFHKTKADLLAHCQSQLSPASIIKAKQRAALIELSSSRAKVTFFVLLTFDKNSDITQGLISILQVKTVINLQKQPDSKWLIEQIEVAEVGGNPISWQQTG
jgi:hypothetical protein